jgi:hypothetical protein
MRFIDINQFETKTSEILEKKFKQKNFKRLKNKKFYSFDRFYQIINDFLLEDKLF